jgi:NAD(P)-dependent dehydrogenase (short-subunit alcohol dehydrogenase family)
VFASCRRAEDVAAATGRRAGKPATGCHRQRLHPWCLAAGTEQTGGRLDALFNNAGFGQPGAVEDISRQAMREQFETNLFGPWELTNAVLPVMRAQGHGRIIYNSSILGFAAMRWRGAYNASKFAMEGMCDTLRQELHGTGIFVSLVEPGPIESRFRPNALQRFLKNVDVAGSVHREEYEAPAGAPEKEGHAAPFTLPATAVGEAVWQAVTASRPKPRYRVTKPTKVFWFLRRVLSTRAFDWALRKAV